MSARGARTRAPSPSAFSLGELEAERLYELLREGRMGELTFAVHAASLEKRSMIGGRYLFWLFARLVNGEDAEGTCEEPDLRGPPWERYL